ncbi:helix-turn-helix domain-containing protein [Aquimarina sp. 2201CG5-10]|uniref:helix-turn-helix domain-containing protein n=1 Tax=Aquimarina callyspongiae TaxID=3098150 RepID=UPI002AB5D7B8|nr:helix-turn-helix domain-containing protein [Aquimarina sp. 2201CG5-10]MDY8135646.1 helix-turn-helix domain-containing protein [Aquimarina sp. 2201CG5-10]
MDFIIIASLLLGLFISVSLFTTSFYKSKANDYLSLSLFLLVSIAFLGWYDAEKGVLEFLQGIMWEFLVPVTLFTYFLIQIQHPYLKKPWLPYLYTFFFVTLLLDVFLDLDFVFNLYHSSFDEEDLIVEIFYTLEDNLSFWYNVILIIWSRRLILKSSIISREKRNWLLHLNLFIILILAIWFIYNLEDTFFDSENFRSLLWTTLSFFCWWLLYYGVFKLQIVIQKDEIHRYLSIQPQKNKIKNDKNTETIGSKHIVTLYTLMDQDELYKNPLLSRLDLAERLGISEGYLSQIINQEIGKSVIQFVNEYRIQFSKQLLHNPDFNKYSIEAIGMESGFKSKSTFYDTFKNYTKMSPGAYRKLQKKS